MPIIQGNPIKASDWMSLTLLKTITLSGTASVDRYSWYSSPNKILFDNTIKGFNHYYLNISGSYNCPHKGRFAICGGTLTSGYADGSLYHFYSGSGSSNIGNKTISNDRTVFKVEFSVSTGNFEIGVFNPFQGNWNTFVDYGGTTVCYVKILNDNASAVSDTFNITLNLYGYCV